MVVSCETPHLLKTYDIHSFVLALLSKDIPYFQSLFYIIYSIKADSIGINVTLEVIESDFGE